MRDLAPTTLIAAVRALREGTHTSQSLLRVCLSAIDAPVGEGQRAFITVHRERAGAEAAQHDAARGQVASFGALAGVPVCIKDLFDEAGVITTAGSMVLVGSAPATADAAAVARLRAAGGIVVGRTNMTEFAYSGVGLNPHYGTPLAPYDRATGRIPGGSTSGGAVAVADGMCFAAVGSDTGGSVRIPAAFCGLVGFKPTYGAIPVTGAFPLAPSFDTVGGIARTVADCRLLDEVLRGHAHLRSRQALDTLTLGIATGLPFADLDSFVGTGMEQALQSLAAAAARTEDLQGVDWSAPGRLLSEGRLTAVESRACHGTLFEQRAHYDPRIAARMDLASDVSAIEYARAMQSLGALRHRFRAATAGIDVIVLPTVACVPPPVAELAADSDYVRINNLVLRNTSIANALGLCAVTLPLPGAGPPVGLLLMAAAGADALLLDAAEAVEDLLRRL